MKNNSLMKRTCLLTVFCFLLGSVLPILAETKDVSDVLAELSLGDLLNLNTSIITATKRNISMRKAPAINTVITSDEIRNMGARNLMDVLKMVPGFGITMNANGRYLIEVRGIKTAISEKILLMIDGHRVNESYSGSAFSTSFNYLSVENIKQIEIIRGPGSALYGANAFLAVVNCITNNADDIDGIEAGIAGGSFDTKKVSLQGGKTFDGFKVFGSAKYFDTNGAGITIDADSIAGTPFSMTPGEADLRIEQTEAFLKLAYDHLSLKSHFIQNDRGTFIGFANALTNDNQYKHKNFWVELAYAKSFTENFSASLRTYYDYFEGDNALELFPEGFPGYPAGAIGKPRVKDRTLGTELQFDLDIFNGHHMITGINFEDIKQYDVTHTTNFNPFTFEPLGSLQDVTSWGNYNKNVTRKVWAAYIQDEWEIRDDLNFTTGVRYDHYDDFGSTVNPRAGVVWNFIENADLKMLYGQAFRAPSFLDLYNDGNLTALGSSDLDPETIRTYEAGLGYRFGDSYMMNMNFFYNDIEDLILLDTSTQPGRYKNMGSAEVYGVETVLMGKYSLTNYWQLTYTWQDAKDGDSNDALPNVPTHRATLNVNYEVCKYLNAHADVFWIGKRERVADDPRKDMSSYATVDISLIAKKFYEGLEVQGTVHNLFDEEYEDPDLSGAAQSIPSDYPREGISALVELRYRF